MRIAIDASAIPRSMAGAGVYTYQLTRALAALPDRPDLLVFAREGLFDDVGVPVVLVEHMSPPMRLAWEQTVLPRLLRRNEVDVLHSPHHHTPILPGRTALGRIRRVVTIHDVTFMVLPGRYPVVRRAYMELVTRTASRVADAIIVPSNAIRCDVSNVLGRDLPIVVVPEAAAPQYEPIVDRSQIADVRARYGLPERFLLSVGSLEPGKNRGRIFVALRKLLDSDELDCPLAIVGQPAWQYEGDQDLVATLGLTEHVRFLGYVADGDLPALYSAATALVFPSLYEGFGLPVIEAMACGAPVITSNTGATAEVGDGAALLIDPRNVDAIAAAVCRMLTDGALRTELRARGIARAADFSWERTARETLSVYQTAAARP
jgi:glycosyltransferase involved in cell wall biosynthesis